MIFWRTEFAPKVPGDKFDKEYAYNIRHNYGEGAGGGGAGGREDRGCYPWGLSTTSPPCCHYKPDRGLLP